MNATVTARTVEIHTGRTGAAFAFAAVTVLLVRMTAAQVRAWSWVGDEWDGTAPVTGYEVRDREGALLGVILPLGHRATRCHVEWYDPQAGDFLAAGETGAVLTQGVARILDARRAVAEAPQGRDLRLDPAPVPVRHNRACPFGYCYDAECIDHGSMWAVAA